MRPPSTDLIAAPGYAPTVGALVAMLDYTRATTLSAVADLTVTQLDHQHDATANPIGALLGHIAAIEWSYVAFTLEGGVSAAQEFAQWGLFLRLGDGARAAAKGRSFEEHAARLAAVRERTLAGLRAVDDAWLAARPSLPWIRGPVTNLWAWYHVMEDELSHRGQIRWLRSRLSSNDAA
jgi:uncharacterized damage-inducible protein DinB